MVILLLAGGQETTAASPEQHQGHRAACVPNPAGQTSFTPAGASKKRWAAQRRPHRLCT